jgi:hypothetical protein
MKKFHLVIIMMFFASVSFAQWTTSGASDIINTNTGKVAIGSTTNLTEKLTINGNIQLNDYDNTYVSRYIKLLSRIRLQSTSHPTNGWSSGMLSQGIYWDNTNSAWSVDGGAYSDFGAIRFENGGAIGFYTRPTTGSSYTLTNSQLESYKRLVVHENGNVGIGTSAPAFPLDVNGSAYVSGGLIANSATSGGMAGFFRGAASANANIVLSGNAGSNRWFWLTTTNDYLKIGGNGGAEPSAGALNIDYLGNVSIGTTSNNGYKLAVNGSAIFTEAKVKLYANWPDYVFHEKYELRSLPELEKFINENNHLPNVPSAGEIKKEGINLGDMNARLLEKIEELTLYVIQLSKENADIKEQLKKLSEKK